MTMTKKIHWVAAALCLCACDGTPNPCAEGVYDPGPPRQCVLDGSVMLLDDGGVVTEDAAARRDAGDSTDASASTDVGVDAGPVAPVTLVAVSATGVPTAGLTVLFHDSGGALIGEATTDAMGRASSGPRRIGMATVVREGGLSYVFLTTVVGPLPGERITFEPPLSIPQGSASYRLPGAYPGAVTYRSHSRLDTLEVADPLDSSVSTRLADDIVVLALDGAGVPLAYATHFDLATMDGIRTDTSVTDWASDFSSLDVSVVGTMPDDYLEARVEFSWLRAGTRVGFGPMFAPPTGTAVPLRVVPTPPGRPLQAAVRIVRPAPMGYIDLDVSVPVVGPLPAALSVRMDEVPRLTDLRVTRTDPGRPIASWTIADVATTDFAGCSFEYSSATAGRSWRMVVSPTATECAIPELPERLADLSPAGSLPAFQVTRMAASDLAGWDEARLRPFGWWDATPGSRLVQAYDFE